MGAVDFFSSLVKMISALAVVLGIMIGAMYFLKRFIKGAGTSIDDGNYIKVISTRYLGPKCNIMLLDILSSVVVIGVSNNQITMLTTISDPKSLEQLKDFEKEKSTPVSILHNLSSYRNRLLAQGHKMKGGRDNE